MRLIDASELLKHKTDHDMISTHLIYNAPTIDAVPVIRCKDCKWFVHDDDCYGDCSNEGGAKDFVYTNDFCSRAERKEE